MELREMYATKRAIILRLRKVVENIEAWPIPDPPTEAEEEDPDFVMSVSPVHPTLVEDWSAVTARIIDVSASRDLHHTLSVLRWMLHKPPPGSDARTLSEMTDMDDQRVPDPLDLDTLAQLARKVYRNQPGRHSESGESNYGLEWADMTEEERDVWRAVADAIVSACVDHLSTNHGTDPEGYRKWLARNLALISKEDQV